MKKPRKESSLDQSARIVELGRSGYFSARPEGSYDLAPAITGRLAQIDKKIRAAHLAQFIVAGGQGKRGEGIYALQAVTGCDTISLSPVGVKRNVAVYILDAYLCGHHRQRRIYDHPSFDIDAFSFDPFNDMTHLITADGAGNATLNVGATLHIVPSTTYPPGAYRGTYNFMINF